MPTVFISGSISIKNIDVKVQERIMNVILQSFSILVGDADGADTSIQDFLHFHDASNVKVYCTGAQPRNNVGGWPIVPIKSYHKPGSRAFFTAKDLAMAADADHGLMVWDSKSTGTLSNVFEILGQKKTALVFINEEREFKKILCVDDVKYLLAKMTPASFKKADDKIDIQDRIDKLCSKEKQMKILNQKIERAESAGSMKSEKNKYLV